MRISSTAVFTALIAFASPAWAHIMLTSPTPRNASDGLKTGPCGNVPRTDAPTVLTPGQTITVEWLETIDHNGYYRVAFAPAGDVGFDENVLLDHIGDTVCTSSPCPYAAEVVLPNEPCEACTLQLIQFMGNGPTYSPYFSCADIVLVGDATAPDGGPGGGGGGDGDATGCNAAGTQAGWIVGFMAIMLLGIRRRARCRR